MILIEKKKKFAYFQLPSQVEMMDKVLPLTNCTSRGDLVRTAVDFYIGYVLQTQNVDYLSPMITSVIKNEIQQTEKGMCEMLFKMAVELDKLNRLSAVSYNYSSIDWEKLNKVCCEDVAYSNGFISLKEANDLIYGKR